MVISVFIVGCGRDRHVLTWFITENSIENPRKSPLNVMLKFCTALAALLSWIENVVGGAGEGTGGAVKTVVS
jgi:hypothetical protein